MAAVTVGNAVVVDAVTRVLVVAMARFQTVLTTAVITVRSTRQNSHEKGGRKAL